MTDALITDAGVLLPKQRSCVKIGIRVATLAALLEGRDALDSAAATAGITPQSLHAALTHLARTST